jgi:hypothetical protein
MIDEILMTSKNPGPTIHEDSWRNLRLVEIPQARQARHVDCLVQTLPHNKEKSELVEDRIGCMDPQLGSCLAPDCHRLE